MDAQQVPKVQHPELAGPGQEMAADPPRVLTLEIQTPNTQLPVDHFNSPNNNAKKQINWIKHHGMGR